jgi:hypothetical protein
MSTIIWDGVSVITMPITFCEFHNQQNLERMHDPLVPDIKKTIKKIIQCKVICRC